MNAGTSRTTAATASIARPVLKAAASLTATSLLVGWLVAPATAHWDAAGQWGPAKSVDRGGRLGINTAAGEGCPAESPDGHLLFFASNRAGGVGPGTNDVWAAFRASRRAAWETPVNLGEPVNSLGNDFCPTPLPGNQLLYVSSRANNCGGPGNNPDIYYTRLQPSGQWLPPQALSCDINSGGEEFSPSFVRAQGRTLLYFSSNRLGTHDIFVSELDANGAWTPAQPVAELNTGMQDSRPNVRKDGLEIVFDSTRDNALPQIYSATRASVFKRWSTPRRLGNHVNHPDFSQTRPTISRDGQRLYFGSSRVDPESGTANDLYVAERQPSRRD